MPNRIEPMALKALGTKGMFHNSQIQALRSYIKNRSDADIVAEINQLTDPAAFNILLEVGLNGTLQEALSARWIRLPK